MHGPASTNGGSYKAPWWPYYPRIEVLDTVALTLRPRRQRKWRRLRDRALEAWEVAGMWFDVDEQDPLLHPPIESADPTDDELAACVVQPYLRLMEMPAPYGGLHPAISMWTEDTNPGALVAIYMPFFWTTSLHNKRYALAHENGHCLGLNHRENTLLSVMGWDWDCMTTPDAHDIDSLEGWYGGG